MVAVLSLTGSAVYGLTTEDMLLLKTSGVSEEAVVLMVESGYQNVQKVIALKRAGFKDDNIIAIIRAESRIVPTGQRTVLQTPAKARIVRYLVFRGTPVLQNSQVMENAYLSLEDGFLKLEWQDPAGLGLLDAFRKKAIASPFVWKLNPKEDSLETGADGYTCLLRSGIGHKGKPDVDAKHLWLLYFDPENQAIIEAIRKKL
jgi:hypothetical protein